ncbi:hypothetical protein P7D73_06770 [Enterococcus raffinosus]|uniref:hypothetical protein n=1 Tax=Enterococcus raffinosus TaxID=71452 RepID=UPI00288F643F|nr:hypothetical protein [Enterococcus raffinosus]MDT2522898.1 hypothetical protein [Enterococcus raffinosus]MDT2532415.1 hypothetical protein [Enterococcus raffinosus]MDT2590250.1 hypothetical protein [Enterococcus raffinosus]
MFESTSEFKFLELTERQMHERIYRIIKVYDSESNKELTFSVNRFVEIPQLRRREKILLEIHLTMRGRNAIPIIKKIRRKEDEEECSQMIQN